MWSFAEIAIEDSNRAERLRSAPHWPQLQTEFLQRFRSSIQSGQIAIGMEQFGRNQEDSRVVLQFHVGETLLDWFFNATTGYRAQFRQGWEFGHACNKDLIKAFASTFSAHVREDIECRILSPNFEDLGGARVTRERVLKSLQPEMSKVWACALVMERGVA